VTGIVFLSVSFIITGKIQLNEKEDPPYEISVKKIKE